MKHLENNAFSRFHPISLAVYFVAVMLITMFCPHPVILLLSLAGGILFSIRLTGTDAFAKDCRFCLPLFFLVTFTNPLFSHNGVTVLFFLNGKPITLEALMYGADLALMLFGVVFWSKCWGAVMTSDKLLFLFGKPFPRLSLVLSMSLRYIPLFKKKWQEIKDAQTALGCFSEGGFLSGIRSSTRIFSALVTWSFENTIDTGMSMSARGYGLKNRTSYSLFRLKRRDVFFILLTLALAASAVVGIATGALAYIFYPAASVPQDGSAILFYVLFGVLALLPFAEETREALTWRYLLSNI
jgi:energy-coupling factor transport system permease protein